VEKSLSAKNAAMRSGSKKKKKNKKSWGMGAERELPGLINGVHPSAGIHPERKEGKGKAPMEKQDKIKKALGKGKGDGLQRNSRGVTQETPGVMLAKDGENRQRVGRPRERLKK